MSAAAALTTGCYGPCHHLDASILRRVSSVNTEIHSREKDINPWAMLPQRGNILGVCLQASLKKKKREHVILEKIVHKISNP